MILEAASFKIKAGESPRFEAAFADAAKVICQASGYISHAMQRSVDVDDHYLLLVKWHTRDDHMIGFRESPLFLEWRRLIGPYFAGTPEVEHYEFFA
jgi:heme-degrading monooxygenase HmoA